MKKENIIFLEYHNIAKNYHCKINYSNGDSSQGYLGKNLYGGFIHLDKDLLEWPNEKFKIKTLASTPQRREVTPKELKKFQKTLSSRFRTIEFIFED